NPDISFLHIANTGGITVRLLQPWIRPLELVVSIDCPGFPDLVESNQIVNVQRGLYDQDIARRRRWFGEFLIGNKEWEISDVWNVCANVSSKNRHPCKCYDEDTSCTHCSTNCFEYHLR